MTGSNSVSRRTVLKTAGAAAATVAIAGCAGNGNGGDGDTDPEAWEDVREIGLTGHTTNGWTGVEPDAIDGVTNPTLVLFEGEEYELTWENEDGVPHNVVITDGGDEIFEESDLMGEQGQTQTVTFTADADMAEYYCNPHPQDMIGSIEVHEV